MTKMWKILWEGHAPPLTPPSPAPMRPRFFEPPPLQISGYATESKSLLVTNSDCYCK